MLSARKAPDWAVSLDQGEDQGQGQAHAAARSSGSPGAAGRKRGANSRYVSSLGQRVLE